MLRNRLYYTFKPFLPSWIRLALRRVHAHGLRNASTDIWPIDVKAGRKPAGWPGWPDAKQFAVVLTHDVEGVTGIARCRQLADLEMQHGFRSVFNFVPEGEYDVPEELLQSLKGNGFEIGVHDLKHDGKLYHSHDAFRIKAKRINHYLRQWQAKGFRSGFMLHNLDWLHDLEIRYDSSTFDTDPYEPQPDGVGTIFPFWVSNGKGRGYVELPYTLVQDSTLYLLLREKTIDVWKRKLDWVAQHGGMALLNVHPDYMSFCGARDGSREFEASLYSEFLRYIESRYSGCYWHALPRDVADYITKNAHCVETRLHSLTHRHKEFRNQAHRKVWIDLENTPHIPFFKPIIRELEKRGCEVVLTARDAYQTCDMATQYGFTYTRIGRHYGKRRLMKLWGLFARSFQLLPFALREKPYLALNHGSRTQTLMCNLLGIPTVTIMDYEHGKDLPFVRPLWEITPDVVSESDVACKQKDKIRKYSGLKEDVYVPDFKPDASILPELGLNGGSIIVTVRPPATEAHYHNPESDVLFALFMKRVCMTPGVKAVLLPRNKRQEVEIRTSWPQWFTDSKVIIPDKVVDGLNLLWHSDLVVSGGGTMNREAAALGVPVYSIFRGTIGAVDRQLQAEARLTLIETPEDVQDRIVFQSRPKHTNADFKPRLALGQIVDHIETILQTH